MAAWDPWAALRARPDIRLAWAWLPAGQQGTVHPVEMGWVITLCAGLGRVERRCALAHELVHVERGVTEGPLALMKREERIVRDEAARRLVPLDALACTVARMESLGSGVQAHHVAAVFDVTHTVAVDALVRLSRYRHAAQSRSS